MTIDHLKNTLRRTLQAFNIGITKYDVLMKLISTGQKYFERSEQFNDVRFLQRVPEKQVVKLLDAMERSSSQIRQDVFVLSELDFRRNGFFVEFGASNGVFASNTYLLEKEFGWTGILAEPARCWHADIVKNRSCAVETKCVWQSSGSEILFNEASNPSLSSVDSLNYDDWAKDVRRIGGTRYAVETISLFDLLTKYDAPKVIDYLSVDAEGSELEILKAFDFSAYSFRVITCEHNNTEMKHLVHALLTANGYVRRHEDLTMFEDWYTHSVAS